MRATREPHSARQRSIAWARLAIATVGILVWAYGVRVDHEQIRWLGILFLAIAFGLRFFARGRKADEPRNLDSSDG